VIDRYMYLTLCAFCWNERNDTSDLYFFVLQILRSPKEGENMLNRTAAAIR